MAHAKKRKDAAPSLHNLAASALGEQARIARRHIRGAIRGADPEQLHDLRVAVRRIRAALRLFERGLPSHGDAMKVARVDLRNAGRILGKARDLDVQVLRIKESLGGRRSATTAPAARILALLQADRAKAWGEMVHFLVAGTFEQQLSRVEGLARSLRETGAARRAKGKNSARQPARLLRRPLRRVGSAISGVRANPGSAPAFHALRIEVKRLRYAAEFLGPGLPFTNVQFLRRMRAAQDQLGSLQDATVELSLAEDLKLRLGADQEAAALLAKFTAARRRDHRLLLASCKRLLVPLEAEANALAQRVERAVN